MRIIGGIHKGYLIKTPPDLPVRPTTDFAKEALFNILSNKINFENLTVLDLFAGTGHISMEFASRGAASVTSVDQSYKCVGFIKQLSGKLKLNITPLKFEVFNYLKNCHQKFDLIFADPPYDLPNIPQIHSFVFDQQLLNQNGILIIEHGRKTKLNELQGFIQERKYGNVNFSFFEKNTANESLPTPDQFA